MGCKKRKKMALGGIDPISLVSIGASLYNNREAKLAEEAAASFAKAEQTKQRLATDTIALENFNQSGTDKPFYANGGMFQLNRRTDGNIQGFKPISNNVLEVVGPKHESGGVPIGNAEVEGGELIKFNPNNTMSVLSDRNKVLGYSPADKVKKGMSANLVDQMFASEMMKQESAKKKFANGVDGVEVAANMIGDIPFDFKNEDYMVTSNQKPKDNKYPKLPYFLDNIANVITTLGTPKVQKPLLTPPVNLNTDINVDPLLSNIQSNELNAVKNVDRNISDSNVATALGIDIGNKATTATNSVLADQINKENDLKNKETMANVNVNMANNSLVNDYLSSTTNRQLGINSSINKNIENLTRDLIDIQDKKNMDKRDIDRVKLQLSQDTKGVLGDAIRTTSAFDGAILSGDIDMTTLHPDTAKAIAEKRTQLLMKANQNK